MPFVSFLCELLQGSSLDAYISVGAQLGLAVPLSAPFALETRESDTLEDLNKARRRILQGRRALKAKILASTEEGPNVRESAFHHSQVGFDS